jgi:hypothetical protein
MPTQKQGEGDNIREQNRMITSALLPYCLLLILYGEIEENEKYKSRSKVEEIETIT